MLEILAAYLFIKCYVSFDASQTSFWGYDARTSGRTAEQCVTEFKSDVERFRTSSAGQRWLGYWTKAKTTISSSFDQQRLQQASALSAAEFDRVLLKVRANVSAAQQAGR